MFAPSVNIKNTSQESEVKDLAIRFLQNICILQLVFSAEAEEDVQEEASRRGGGDECRSNRSDGQSERLSSRKGYSYFLLLNQLNKVFDK